METRVITNTFWISSDSCIFECFHFKQERVSEINKRTLGKFIIKLCGNEGTRMYRCIDSIEKHPDVNWTNAVLEIYGDDGTPRQITEIKSILLGKSKLDNTPATVPEKSLNL